ncbi:hypothetical protein SAMN04488245_12221 [Alloyangia pacifica]|uniref:Uncharacterized protein n=2 Tax=Alloyangia pacifica TaxID=311180 RepID=A0A1I6RL00_9RHOB|nr:hypothetical protein SAMN04488245_12221 [Alloyangia pacifica]SFS65453.1 hypothetical protein SAMN04488050_103175 [Alloyangia pacifica]
MPGQPMPRPVDTDDLPEYPISASDRLDSHFFISWNLKRWRKSVLRRLAEPEVGWYAFQLICEAHDETPVGTLPTDERLLTEAVGVSLDRWRQLCKRDITPLHNWYFVRCDNGEIRYAHPVVQEVALKALNSRRKSLDDMEQRRYAKRLKDLGDMIEHRIKAPQVLRVPGFLEAFNAWLEEHYPGVRRTEGFIHRALSDYQLKMSP